MRDQAEKLRRIIDNIRKKDDSTTSTVATLPVKKLSRVIAVTSGKGGVGKTNITVNLGVTLSEMGYRVAILDADFGLANIDVLMGVIPKFTLVDVIRNKKNILEVLSDGPSNVRYISGGSGVEELVKLDAQQLLHFVKGISLLDRLTDIILIDTAAGISENVMSLLLASDEVLLITTPEPTSITDAYALIKLLASKQKSKKVKVIVNRADNQIEATDIFNKLNTVSKRFLSMELDSFGFVLNDECVSKAVKMQKPFSICFPKCSAAKMIKEISEKLTSGDKELSVQAPGMKNFISRLVKIISA